MALFSLGLCMSGNGCKIRSPHQQAYRYKSCLYELHLPVLGLKELANSTFYRIIDVYVYFHKASSQTLNQLYDRALAEVKLERQQTNANRDRLSFEKYDAQINYWESRTRLINRDKSISLCLDSLDKKLKKISGINRSALFTDDIYIDFKRRLLPPEQTMNQGIPINFDAKQSKLLISEPGLTKIKGVAGCGKTTILAKRALNALERHGDNVLILSYNITIRHYIKDTLSRISEKSLSKNIEVIHYHGFIGSKINEHNIDLKSELEKFQGTDCEKLEKVYARQDLFKGKNVEKYKTIFIDEVQDYDPNWIKIMRDNFLDDEGEMVLFGDQSQNIYNRDSNQRESAIVKGFGGWKKLTKSYRSNIDSPYPL